MILSIQNSPKFNRMMKHYNFTREHMKGGLTLELIDLLRGHFHGEPVGGMLVPIEHPILGFLLAVQRKKSKKVLETKTCMRTGHWPNGKLLGCERCHSSSIPRIDSGLTGACPHI
jgi:hypothetical protein